MTRARAKLRGRAKVAAAARVHFGRNIAARRQRALWVGHAREDIALAARHAAEREVMRQAMDVAALEESGEPEETSKSKSGLWAVVCARSGRLLAGPCSRPLATAKYGFYVGLGQQVTIKRAAR